MRRLLPRPALSISLFLLWAVLGNAASLASLLLGALLSVLLPFIVSPFWPDALHIQRPTLALRFAARIGWDILLANWAVARRVVGPVAALHPAFVDVPLDLRDPFAATVLGSVVSLTPGTVSIDVDRERWVLQVHALDAPDPQALVREIKQRYEAPIREIFAC
ncbi:MAG: Na+/H+ antiporter subunit E [Gammaproteobacteria bacterium]|nr:Na+/H+ antiporter subunit E [Gammaproteobacteria bacterium]MBU1624075.1 Na+/H+ antiporter subunit E [Gammaproteobacteria bacterium]MBU1981803.1 Na+/H+ antiporter subunit E [Gammaproteobacteria bacterium]